MIPPSNKTPPLTHDLRQSRNGPSFPKRSRTKATILPQLNSEIMRRETEAANSFKLPGTAFFLIISLKHPRLHARMLLQPLSNRLHGIPSPYFLARFLPYSRQDPPATPSPPRPQPPPIPLPWLLPFTL